MATWNCFNEEEFHFFHDEIIVDEIIRSQLMERLRTRRLSFKIRSEQIGFS